MKVDLNASIGLKEVRELAVDFLSWWRKELGSLVPERFRRIADSSFARRTIRLEGDVWQVSKSGSEQEILTLDMSEPSDVLHQRIRRVDAACLANRLDAELPASCGLLRRTRLPAAAERKLLAVVGLSLGRLSPFRAGDVSYDARIVGPAEGGQIDVEVGIVPKETLERFETRLAALGIHVRAFRIAGCPLQFRPATRIRTANERIQLLLGGVAVLAWLIAIFAIPMSRQAELASLSADLASLRGPAGHAKALGSELLRLQRPFNAASARLAGPDALDALRVLSIVLPSDVQISSFDLDEGKLRVTGTGAEPAQIRDLLGKTAYFHEVTVTQPGGDETFRAEMLLTRRR